jgi:hypothetical protein
MTRKPIGLLMGGQSQLQQVHSEYLDEQINGIWGEFEIVDGAPQTVRGGIVRKRNPEATPREMRDALLLVCSFGFIRLRPRHLDPSTVYSRGEIWDLGYSRARLSPRISEGRDPIDVLLGGQSQMDIGALCRK